MAVLLLLFALSLCGLVAALLVPGWSDLLLLAGPCALAALLLLWRGRGRGQAAEAVPILVDGSNVMFWRGKAARIETVREVVTLLEMRGYAPGVVFDANAGYRLADRYLDDAALASLLDLPEERVLVVAKGTPADPVILAAARDRDARIVSNDRFRDWAGAFPEVAGSGRLVPGGVRRGTVWLALDAGNEEALDRRAARR